MSATKALYALFDLENMTALKYDGYSAFSKDWETVSWKYFAYHEVHEIEGGCRVIQTSRACNDNFDEDSMFLAVVSMVKSGEEQWRRLRFIRSWLVDQGYRSGCRLAGAYLTELLQVIDSGKSKYRRSH